MLQLPHLQMDSEHSSVSLSSSAAIAPLNEPEAFWMVHTSISIALTASDYPLPMGFKWPPLGALR